MSVIGKDRKYDHTDDIHLVAYIYGKHRKAEVETIHNKKSKTTSSLLNKIQDKQETLTDLTLGMCTRTRRCHDWKPRGHYY